MDDDDQAELRSGRQVILHGLQNRPELNRRRGVIVAYDLASQRYAVEVKATKKKGGASVRARASNLFAMPLASEKPEPGMPAPSHWAQGLSADAAYEWFCDCYCMRCDDDAVHGGCDLHGPYDEDPTVENLLLDFLIFVKLAVSRGVIPAPGSMEWEWNWDDFVAKAPSHIVYAFEKSDAKEKYGSENIFMGAMGGRSLRFTGEVITGSGVSYAAEEDDLASRVQSEVEDVRSVLEEVLDTVDGASTDVSLLPVRALTAFDDVGGLAPWRTLYALLAPGCRSEPDGDYYESYDY